MIVITPATRNDSRALVVIAEAAHRAVYRLSIPAAPYLAQLIATKYGFPQTRRRRRADSHGAAAIYEAHSSSDATGLHHLLSREL
jgi:hypothetical protein